MRRVEVFIHPTCISSYYLVKGLAERSLLNKLVLYVACDPSYALKRGAFSVPWVVVDGVPTAADPVSVDEVELIIEGRSLEPLDPFTAIKNTILHSGYLSSIVALWGSLKPVIMVDVISIATRSHLTRVDVHEALRAVLAKGEELYKELVGQVTRSLAVNFTRELFWASNGALDEKTLKSTATPLVIRAWLIAKASIGRVGLPSRPWKAGEEVAKEVANFIQRGSKRVLNKVKEEYTVITSDEDYWRVIKTCGAAGI